jgi:hypothetical protein
MDRHCGVVILDWWAKRRSVAGSRALSPELWARLHGRHYVLILFNAGVERLNRSGKFRCSSMRKWQDPANPKREGIGTYAKCQVSDGATIQ